MEQIPLNISDSMEKKVFTTEEKPKDVRHNNILAAKTLSDIVRTSLGPKGMDKMIKDSKGKVIITNDGATIVNHLQVLHPTAKMLVETSKAQDIAAGDGTTSVVILAGALLGQAQILLDKNISPTVIADGFSDACNEAQKVINEIESPVELDDRESLIQNCITSLSSKVVSNYSEILAPLAVDAVMKLVKSGDIYHDDVDLKDIRVSKKLGGTIEDTKMVDGIVFTDNKVSKAAGGPTKVENPKIGLIQFSLANPKTDMDSTLQINDYSQMDRVLKQERKHILSLVKKIQASGCNVLLIQKSILRDAVNDLALHYLAKAKIMVIKDIEREDVEFICKTLNCKPIAHIDSFKSEGSKIVEITGVPNESKTVSILCRGSNQLVLDETERSLHDALCVIRSIIKRKAMIPGGSAPETEIAVKLTNLANETQGFKSYCFKGFADALEVIPYTLAENAGLKPVEIVTELRNKHKKGEKNAGINVKKGTISDMLAEKVIQPSLVTISALKLATEVVRMILKIDDIVICR